MKRRLLNLLAALSLLLCVATVVLFVRSYFASDQLGLRYGQPHSQGWAEQDFFLTSGEGFLRIWRFYEISRLNDPTHPHVPLPVKPQVYHNAFDPSWMRED